MNKDSLLKETIFGRWGVKIQLVLLLIFGGGLRCALAPLVRGLPFDITTFYTWAIYLTQNGLHTIYYDSEVFCDYPPLYLLVLRGLGWLIKTFSLDEHQIILVLKMPAILADLACGLLIYKIFSFSGRSRLALTAAALMILHPVSIYDSAIWGQIDSLTLFFQLISIFAVLRGYFVFALVLSALNILIKPQGLILLPIVLLVIIQARAWKALLLGTLASFLTAIVVTFPFTLNLAETLPLLWNNYLKQAALYPYSAVQTFNFWGLTGMWLPDQRNIFTNQPEAIWFLQHRTWGLVFFGSALGLSLLYCKRLLTHNRAQVIWLSSAFLLSAFFMFPTRMHERYLFSGLFFALAGATFDPRLWWAFGVYSVTQFLNLLYVFPGETLYLLEEPGISLNQLIVDFNLRIMPWVTDLIIVLNLLVFGMLSYYLFKEILAAPAKQSLRNNPLDSTGQDA